jgi:uncharacterized membrane protein YhaH (DUF805 family)
MSTVRRVLSLWFGFTAPVDRRTYAVSGFALMAFKYASDALLVWLVLGTLWSPTDYLLPLLTLRAKVIPETHAWLMAVLLAWAVPFAWIGASMTFRRALDAGLSPWGGLVFFVPVFNYLWMLLLCVLPSGEPRTRALAQEPKSVGTTRALLGAAAPAAALGVGATALSVFFFDSYLAMLFVGTPVAVGFVAGFRAERAVPRGTTMALSAAMLALLLVAGALVLFALEGVLCIAMAFPIASVLAVVGAVIGLEVADSHRLRPNHVLTLLTALPLLMGAEASGPGASVREVVSSIEIAAPPEVVWPYVIGFTDLTPPHELVFASGIAYPVRARIEGAGVGAVRYCEFSTGAFVEPITVWDPPHRLAFDVASQPEPMHETSPYQRVNAPHLVDGLRSRRGEFRLVPLEGGRTRLEGSTWYSVEMAPQFYWGFLSDQIIHAIHERVLAHVETLVRSNASRRS